MTDTSNDSRFTLLTSPAYRITHNHVQYTLSISYISDEEQHQGQQLPINWKAPYIGTRTDGCY